MSTFSQRKGLLAFRRGVMIHPPCGKSAEKHGDVSTEEAQKQAITVHCLFHGCKLLQPQNRAALFAVQEPLVAAYKHLIEER